MKNSVRGAMTGLILLCALPINALACRILAEGEAAQLNRARIEKAKADATALYAEVDTVFTGRISRLTFSQETAKDAQGRDVTWQTHQIEFDLVDNLKGTYAPGQVLEFKVNKSVVEFRCGPKFLGNLPRENGTGETYLVYARDGKILRTNHMPVEIQDLNGYEEAGHLRGAQ